MKWTRNKGDEEKEEVRKRKQREGWKIGEKRKMRTIKWDRNEKEERKWEECRRRQVRTETGKKKKTEEDNR